MGGFLSCSGQLATVQLLLKRKANVAAKDKKGSTALDLATDPDVRAALEQALSAAAQPQVLLMPLPVDRPCNAGAAVTAPLPPYLSLPRKNACGKVYANRGSL